MSLNMNPSLDEALKGYAEFIGGRASSTPTERGEFLVRAMTRVQFLAALREGVENGCFHAWLRENRDLFHGTSDWLVWNMILDFCKVPVEHQDDVPRSAEFIWAARAYLADCPANEDLALMSPD